MRQVERKRRRRGRVNVSSGWSLEFGPIDAPPWPVDTQTRHMRLDDCGRYSCTAIADAFSGRRQPSEGTHEPIEDRRAAHTCQLEGERVRPSHLGLELNL